MKNDKDANESIHVQVSMRVVPLESYCSAVKLEKSSIHARINRGVWRIGHEVIKVKGVKGLHIDLDAVDSWFRNPENQVF